MTAIAILVSVLGQASTQESRSLPMLIADLNSPNDRVRAKAVEIADTGNQGGQDIVHQMHWYSHVACGPPFTPVPQAWGVTIVPLPEPLTQLIAEVGSNTINREQTVFRFAELLNASPGISSIFLASIRDESPWIASAERSPAVLEQIAIFRWTRMLAWTIVHEFFHAMTVSHSDDFQRNGLGDRFAARHDIIHSGTSYNISRNIGDFSGRFGLIALRLQTDSQEIFAAYKRHEESIERLSRDLDVGTCIRVPIPGVNPSS